MNTDRYVINSVLRAAQLLECFSFDKPAYRNAELSKKLGLNKSTITRLLCSLQKAGFLEKDAKTGEYGLTDRVFRIGTVYISQVDFHKEAMPVLSDLASSCEETVHLAVLHEFEVFYLDKVDSPQSIGMRSRVGASAPAYCTALGKVLLAHLNDVDLESLLRSIELKPFTDNTITDPARLMVHLRDIRHRGYAIDNAEHQAEVKCVAAPVHSAEGKTVASISISGPIFRMTPERIENDLIAAVTETAHKISSRLGHLDRERIISPSEPPH